MRRELAGPIFQKPNCAGRGVRLWKVPCPRREMTKDGSWVLSYLRARGENKRRLVQRGLAIGTSNPLKPAECSRPDPSHQRQVGKVTFSDKPTVAMFFGPSVAAMSVYASSEDG